MVVRHHRSENGSVEVKTARVRPAGRKRISGPGPDKPVTPARRRHHYRGHIAAKQRRNKKTRNSREAKAEWTHKKHRGEAKKGGNEHPNKFLTAKHNDPAYVALTSAPLTVIGRKAGEAVRV